MAEEDVFEINDFSTSSDWERFIADLEEILTEWKLGGTSDDLSVVEDDAKAMKSPVINTSITTATTSSKLFSDSRRWSQKEEQLKFGKVSFTLTYFYFKHDDDLGTDVEATKLQSQPTETKRSWSKTNGNTTIANLFTSRAWLDMNAVVHDWTANGHPLVRYYGFSQFLVLCPLRSETISTEDRIKHLIGSATVALNNLNCEVPFFAQICQPYRRMFTGVLSLNNGFRTYFDMIQFPEVPPSYQYVSQLLPLFRKKVRCPFSYSAAHLDRNTPTHRLSDEPKLVLSIRFTYILTTWPPQYLLYNGNVSNHPALEQFEYFRSELKPTELLLRPATFSLVENQYADPLKQIQLATTWPAVEEELITDTEYHTDLHPRNAPRWALRTLFVDNQPTKASKLTHATEWLRAFAALRYQYKSTLLHTCSSRTDESESGEVNVRSALDRLARPSTEQLFTASKNVLLTQLERNFFTIDSQSPNVDNMMKFLFEETSEKFEELNSACASLKSAPVGSLSWRIAMLLGNHFVQHHQISTVALIWSAFVEQLRSHWAKCQVLPLLHTEPEDCIDYGHCLLHQKLQMLNCCIRQKAKREMRLNDAPKNDLAAELKQETNDDEEEEDEFFDCDDEEPSQSPAHSPDKGVPQGLLKMLKDASGQVVCLLDQPNKPICVPITQDPAPMTEDHVQKQMQTLAALSGTPDEAKQKIRLQSAGLLSDMEAFKAANPGAKFEDFIRWHSPRDWIELDESTEPSPVKSANRGKTKFGLSRRMRESTMWIEIWDLARSLPVTRQKRLFNYTKEAEEILHWFKNVSVNQLVELVGPILAKATIAQIMQYRDEIGTFVSDNLTETETTNLTAQLLPFDFALIESHFSRGDYDGICIELSNVEFEVVKFYSLLKKLIFAFESQVKKPFKAMYVSTPTPPKEGQGDDKQSNLDAQKSKPQRTNARGVLTDLNAFQKSDLTRLVTRLLLEPEVEFPSSDCSAVLVVRIFSDSVRFQYESTTAVGDRVRSSAADDELTEDNDNHEDDDQSQKKRSYKPSVDLQLPPPAGKEFIFRAGSIARPAPYSRPSPQRLYCLMQPTKDFRIATAFTEDVAYF